MTAVVCKSGYNLGSNDVGFGYGVGATGESGWLLGMGTVNDDGHGVLYYHGEGYLDHDYQVLQHTGPINTFDHESSNHIYRRSGAVNSSENSSIFSRFIQSSRNSFGQVFMGHVRKRSSGPLGAYAPFTYRRIDYSSSVTDTTDYSFSHHGTIVHDQLKIMLSNQSYKDWLIQYDTFNIINGNPTTYSDSTTIANYVDSDYLFLWLIKHIEENGWNVKSGLVSGLTALRSLNIQGMKSIFFSDGTGVYAYTNESDSTHKMSYIEDSASFKVRSTVQVATGWTQFSLRHLYYFPVQGEMSIVYHADGSEVASFPVKVGLNWVSFPVINSTYGTAPDYTLQDVNPYALNLQTKNGTELQLPWMYNSDDNSWPTSAIISRTNGYILQLNEDLPESTLYTTYGTQTPYDTTLNLLAGNENWVPYFVKYSQTPAGAFGSNFANVTAIYAQDWYIYKFKGKWYGYYNIGATGTLDYGKMYKVYVDQNIPSFTWSTFGVSPTFVKSETNYFIYEEKPEYQAIVIESIPEEPQFDELGVYKDGVCVGAIKFDGYPLNLQIYDNSSPDEFEYVLYTEAKHNGFEARKYSSDKVAINDRVTSNGKNMFSIISLNGSANVESIPVPVFSASIYPNPSRGNANIEIQASSKSLVDITIYNLRGQTIRRIKASGISIGRSTIVWDGKTDDGRAVAKGIYFCKINSGNYTLTKKMIVVD